MRIREACTACGLTKKAIEYYAAQGLVRPAVSENGYRDFSAEDVGRLEKIALLRRLDLPVARIREVLDGDGAAALCAAAAERRREIAAEGERLALLQALSQGGDWASIAAQADALERKQTIQRRLLRAFPGGYGQYLCLHFGRFLDEPVVGPEQQAAFAAVVDFLDCKNRYPSPICTRFEHHFHALKPHLRCLSFKLPRSRSARPYMFKFGR